MIGNVKDFVEQVTHDVAEWRSKKPSVRPWFRGESDHPDKSKRDKPLCPKIAFYTAKQENYLLQTFRRRAGGIANTPAREHTDIWLFLAQHYKVPTRLLDWTEGALFALYFAINENRKKPRVYMLDPHGLNRMSLGDNLDGLNYPLTWANKPGYENIALAWEHRNPNRGYELPIAVPAAYQDRRMIAQRSCFTIHGRSLKPLASLLRVRALKVTDYLIEYRVRPQRIDSLLIELDWLGISGSSAFPDLDHVGLDIGNEANRIDNRDA